MIPNKSLDRLFAQEKAGPTQAASPGAAVPYEEVDAELWDFYLRNGPHQFVIEPAKGDSVVEEKDRFKIRCRQDKYIINVCIYKAAIEFQSMYEGRARVLVTAEAPKPFKPTKAKR